ncbi:MAG: hypothetical protein ACC650_08530 [Gammaproteobacteria bacterium]
MKKVAIILAGIAVFIGISIGAVFMMTSGMTDTATAFFTDIRAKDYPKAYSYFSEDFKSNTSQKEFVKFLEKSSLLNFKDSSWGSRSISGGKGSLVGSVTTESGGVVPITLGFIKENETWKIYSIYKPRSGISQDDEVGKIPSSEELVELTNESMLKFAESVNASDFKIFHSYISNLWRKQFTVEKFNTTFKSFIDAKINLVPALNTTSPVFDSKPSLNTDGVLTLEGHYPTTPSQLKFKLKYIFEGISWKLIGTSVYI